MHVTYLEWPVLLDSRLIVKLFQNLNLKNVHKKNPNSAFCSVEILTRESADRRDSLT